MTPSQIRNTKQPHSGCLCTVNYLNFTHPPKTGCQNPCRNGFFIRSEGERGGAEENRRRGEGEENKKKKTGGGERERETAGGGGGESEGDAVKRRWLAGEH